MKNFIAVICIKSYKKSKIQKNNYYLIDLDSIWTDDLGNNFGEVYDFLTEKHIGCYNLQRFVGAYNKKSVI